MTLVVHELEASGLYQTLTPSKNVQVEHVRPHLYRHLWPTGTLKLQIQDSDGNTIAESASVTIADIGSEDYAHGYVRFDVNAHLRKDMAYRFKLVGDGGYSFTEAAYIGWCNGFDLGKYDGTYDDADKGLLAPLDLEIWERKEK